MPFSVQCEGCGQSLIIPDQHAGSAVPCPNCGTQVIAEAPLMPPPMGGPVPTPRPSGSPTVSVRTSTAPAPGDAPTIDHVPSTAPPPSRVARGAPPPGAAPPPAVSAPPPAPPAAPPPRTAPPPRRQGDAPVESFEIESHEGLERALQLKRRNPIGIIMTVLVISVAGLVLAGYGIMALMTKNPPVGLQEQIKPNRQALSMMGQRQTGAGYSFVLPKNFVPAAQPSTDNLPRGTVSYGWQADPESEDQGSEFRIWVIPEVMNLKEQFHKLKTLGSRLEYHAVVLDKSSYRRIGDDLLCVVGRVDGSTKQTTRKGVVYLIVDGKRTLMVVGMGVGGNWKELLFMLENSPLTIQRAS